MRPLTLDDLLPLDEYACRRREFFEAHCRYLDRYRRVRIGPSLTLIFENRQTLWFRVQELLRVARLGESKRVQQELDFYNRFLPGHGQLQAATILEITDETRLTQELANWQGLRGEELKACVGDAVVPAVLVTCRPEDGAIGTAHWVRFEFTAEGKRQLGDFRLAMHFAVKRPGYEHASAPLSEDVRQSLIDDLEMA